MIAFFSKKWTCSVCGQRYGEEVRFCPKDGTKKKVHRSHYDAFISYRRDHGSEAASVIQLLLEQYHKYAFLDVTELQVGRFDEKLLEEIESSDAFILVLSPGALDRCVNKTDWLKREIVHALQHQKNIIPVILPKFEFPNEATLALLPEEMRNLPNFQAVQYSHENREAMGRKIAEYISAGTRREKKATTGKVSKKSPPPEEPARSRSAGNDRVPEQLPTPNQPVAVPPPATGMPVPEAVPSAGYPEGAPSERSAFLPSGSATTDVAAGHTVPSEANWRDISPAAGMPSPRFGSALIEKIDSIHGAAGHGVPSEASSRGISPVACTPGPRFGTASIAIIDSMDAAPGVPKAASGPPPQFTTVSLSLSGVDHHV